MPTLTSAAAGASRAAAATENARGGTTTPPRMTLASLRQKERDDETAALLLNQTPAWKMTGEPHVQAGDLVVIVTPPAELDLPDACIFPTPSVPISKHPLMFCSAAPTTAPRPSPRRVSSCPAPSPSSPFPPPPSAAARSPSPPRPPPPTVILSRASDDDDSFEFDPVVPIAVVHQHPDAHPDTERSGAFRTSFAAPPRSSTWPARPSASSTSAKVDGGVSRPMSTTSPVVMKPTPTKPRAVATEHGHSPTSSISSTTTSESSVGDDDEQEEEEEAVVMAVLVGRVANPMPLTARSSSNRSSYASPSTSPRDSFVGCGPPRSVVLPSPPAFPLPGEATSSRPELERQGSDDTIRAAEQQRSQRPAAAASSSSSAPSPLPLPTTRPNVPLAPLNITIAPRLPTFASPIISDSPITPSTPSSGPPLSSTRPVDRAPIFKKSSLDSYSSSSASSSSAMTNSPTTPTSPPLTPGTPTTTMAPAVKTRSRSRSFKRFFTIGWSTLPLSPPPLPALPSPPHPPPPSSTPQTKSAPPPQSVSPLPPPPAVAAPSKAQRRRSATLTSIASPFSKSSDAPYPSTSSPPSLSSSPASPSFPAAPSTPKLKHRLSISALVSSAFSSSSTSSSATTSPSSLGGGTSTTGRRSISVSGYAGGGPASGRKKLAQAAREMPSSPAVPEGGFVAAKEAMEARRDVPPQKAKAAAVAVAEPTMKSLTMTTIEAEGANKHAPVRSFTAPVLSTIAASASPLLPISPPTVSPRHTTPRSPTRPLSLSDNTSLVLTSLDSSPAPSSSTHSTRPPASSPHPSPLTSAPTKPSRSLPLRPPPPPSPSPPSPPLAPSTATATTKSVVADPTTSPPPRPERSSARPAMPRRTESHSAAGMAAAGGAANGGRHARARTTVD